MAWYARWAEEYEEEWPEIIMNMLAVKQALIILDCTLSVRKSCWPYAILLALRLRQTALELLVSMQMWEKKFSAVSNLCRCVIVVDV